jgi:hypothetical protein
VEVNERYYYCKIFHVGHLHSIIFGAFINSGVLHGQSVIMNDSRLPVGNGSTWVVIDTVPDHAIR